MMKSMDDNSNGGNSNSSSSNNWLGFTLSPHMKMELAVSSSMFLPPHHQQLNSSTAQGFSVCAGGGEHGDVSSVFHHPHNLTVMPIKSDGSLCIMEALTRSQSEAMVPASSPKLENFLGGTNMALSLDSMYYNHEEANQQHSIDILQQHHHYYGDGGLFQAPKNTIHMSECEAQISEMANWVARSYTTHQGNEQNMGGGSDTTVTTMVDNGGSSPTGSIASMACGDIQSLTLSMSPGSQSSCVNPAAQMSPSTVECLSMESKKRGPGKVLPKQPVHRKSIDTFGQRTSQYRGVTKHRWTGRYEAHLWDNSCKKEGQTRKGRQVYLGGYDKEEKAARAYDLAALKYWGPSTHINFPLENYKDELEEMKNMTRQEYVAHLRRKSSGFSRGASMYRGVTRHHQHGRWQARIGRVAGNKDLYLGTFSTQEEAAEAYDIAAIKFRGVNAVTNFDITRYDVEKIMSSNTLLAGEQAKRIKAMDPTFDPIDPSPSPHAKMVLCEQNPCMETALDHQRQQGSSFSVALHDLIGVDSLNSTMGDDSNKMVSVQFSNASSIITSLNSSREGSPDKSGSSSNIYHKSPIAWIPMAQLPVFAAWNDAQT